MDPRIRIHSKIRNTDFFFRVLGFSFSLLISRERTNPLFCAVVPEDGEDAVEMQDDDNTYIEDQSDVDARKAEIARLAREAALAKRSSAVKRDMPRPTEMNNAVLRMMNSDPPLTELQVWYGIRL
jgi:hypothetical protein